MDHGRTGTRYRFRIATPGGGRVSNVVANVVLWCFGVGVALGLGVFSLHALRTATSRHSALHRLLREPTADERARGRVWGAMTVRTANGRPLCYVEHQHYVSGKNGGWRTDSHTWLGDWVTFETPWGGYLVDRFGLAFEPLEPSVPADASPYLEQGTDFPPGGRIRVQCLPDGGRFFGDLCVRDGTVGRCRDGSLSMLTAGDGRPTARVRYHASTVAGGFSAALLLLGLLALYGWYVVRVGAIVDALGAWSKTPAPGSRLGIWVGIAGGGLFGLMVALILAEKPSSEPHYVGGYAFGVVVLGATAAVLLRMRDRRVGLRRALEPVEAAETKRLARVGEGLAELVVRVPKDAPTVSFPGLPPCAFLSVAVGRVKTVGKNQQVVPLHAARWPTRIPVEDPSGVGMLDLTGATLDLRAVFFHTAGLEATAFLRMLGATPFGLTGAEHDDRVSLEVEVSYIAPGESLYLLGRVHRVEDPNASTSYRAMATLPVIAADEQERLVVHAGGEATLRRALSREHGYLTGAMGTLAVAGIGLVVALLWLASRA